MPTPPHQLPDDVTALKALVATQAAHNEELLAQKQAGEQENVRLNAKVLSLQEQLNLALARRYAASSEKLSPDQVSLFDEAECDANLEVDEEDDTETISVPAHTRKKSGRTSLPDTLPRIASNTVREGERLGADCIYNDYSGR